MAGVPGYYHKIQISSASDDDAGTPLDAADYAYKANSGLVVPTVTTRFHDVKSEGGRSTSLPESVGVPISVDQSFSMGFNAYNDSLAHFTFLGAHGGASNTGAAIGATAAYVHEWEWPGTSGTFMSTFMEVLGKTGSDDNQNRDLNNVIVEKLSIQGSRDNPITMQVDWRGGGVTADGGSGTGSLDIDTTRLFTFGMVNLYHCATAGFAGATPAYDWVNAHTTADTSLASTVIDLTSYLQSFNLTFTRTPDVPRSKAPGNVDSNDAGIVPDALDWIEDTNGPDATLEMVFTDVATATSAALSGFPRDKEAGTARGFELWIEETTASVAGAILGAAFTFGNVQIIETNEVERGGGVKDLRVLARPIYDSTLGNGAFISTSSLISDELGA